MVGGRIEVQELFADLELKRKSLLDTMLVGSCWIEYISKLI